MTEDGSTNSGEHKSPAASAAANSSPVSNVETRLQDSKNRHLLRAAIVGILAGLLAVAFKWVLVEAERSRGNFLEWLHGMPRAEFWGWAVLPIVGLCAGSLIGWVVLRFAPDAAGSGIPHLKGVLLHVRTMRWKRLLPIKFLGGILGIGVGLSMGREGPTVQMGAAIGQAVAGLLRIPSRSVPQLLTCGAGAGIAAAFNAPLAGFLFVIEEMHRELSARTFAGALVAALTADIVARALGGDLPSFGATGYSAIPLSALPAAAFVGVAGGLLGVLFNRVLLKSCASARKIRAVPSWMLPGIAAAICGFAAWWLPEAVGGGHSIAEKLLGGHLGWGLGMLFVLLLVKFVLTILSYSSGAPGGIFAPILLLGAISGAMIGEEIARFFPALEPHITAFAVLGMAAFFTGSIRAPLTGIVLIVEMTGNYQQLLALGVTCLISDLVAGALKDVPIYEALLEADVDRMTAEHGALTITKPHTVYLGIQHGSSLAGRTIRESGLPAGCLVIGIERAGQEVLPEARFVMLPGDHLMVMVPAGEMEMTTQVVRMATGI
ncbi:MAG: H(+)/Cl(-) exchange transporter ClcA [Phycisphaeraceae bacterium]|nr:H(+)/Cl(-) exchange transporter ClcA [Phycisphaeraceae bacterium]